MVKDKSFLFSRNHNFLNKKGQITIFIIAGIVIVGIIILFFIVSRSIRIPELGTEEINPSSFLESCLEDSVSEGLNKLSLQGGNINPILYKSFKFEGEDYKNISYLCYNPNFYVPCVNQEPMLIQHLKNELRDYVSEDVGNCFDSMVKSFQERGYDVSSNYKGFEINFAESKVGVDIDADISLTRAGETSAQENFDVSFQSRFYDLAIVVQEIVSQEAEYCNFEYLGYMLLYPEWEITKTGASDSAIIYTVKHEDSKEKFRFAVRGCVIKPGI